MLFVQAASWMEGNIQELLKIKKGGAMLLSLIKRILVKLVSFTLSNFTSLQTRDATNGFRLFSYKIIKEFNIESVRGFTFSIELLAKAHRYGYKITEIPEKWPVRKQGKSKFKYSSIFFYLRWYFHIFATTFIK